MRWGGGEWGPAFLSLSFLKISSPNAVKSKSVGISSTPTPTIASAHPIAVVVVSFFPPNAKSRRGTTTTARLQMKADLQAEVVSRPRACAR